MRPRGRNNRGRSNYRNNNRDRGGRSGPRRPMDRPDDRRMVSMTLSNLRKNMDINCNVGQGFGIYQYSHEEELFEYVTSVNIACGMHAGDPKTISKMVNYAKEYGTSTGALIGYQDIIGNGQRETYLDVDELRALVLYQLGAVKAILHAKGLDLRHVRPHGFLYKQIYTDQLIADTVAKAISEFSHWVSLIGLAGPVIQNACTNANIKMGQEVLIDRRYRRDGTVLPFSDVIDEKSYTESAIKRAREVIQLGMMTCEGGGKIKLNPNTIHIPSERKESVELARAVRSLVSDPKPLNLDRYDEYFADMAELST